MSAGATVLAAGETRGSTEGIERDEAARSGFDMRMFVETFDLFSQVEGGVEQLRRLIRDLAVRGLLLKHLDGDGAGQSLLAAIQRDRVRGGVQGRSMRSGDDPADERENPFEIPPNWCWTTLGDVSVKRGR